MDDDGYAMHDTPLVLLRVSVLGNDQSSSDLFPPQ